MRKTTVIVLWAAATLLAGCQSHEKARQDAEARWSLARNKVHYQLAQDMYDAGQVDKCKAQLRKVMTREPVYGPAYLLAAKLAIGEQRFNDAQTYLNLAVGADPGAADVWYTSALLNEYCGDLDAAIEAMGKAAVLDPEDPEYLVCLAELQVQGGEADKALATLASAEDRFSSHVGFQSALADLYALHGQHDNAVRCLRRMLRMEPGQAETRCRLATELTRDGQYHQAVPLLEDILADEPEGTLALRAALGRCYVARERYADAEAVYLKLSREQPARSEWRYHLAECYAARDKDVEALAQAEQVLDLDPGHADALALAGTLCYGLGAYEQAEEYLRQAIDAIDEPTLVAVILTRTLQALDRDDEAGEVWAEFGGPVQAARQRGAVEQAAVIRPESWTLAPPTNTDTETR